MSTSERDPKAVKERSENLHSLCPLIAFHDLLDDDFELDLHHRGLLQTLLSHFHNTIGNRLV